MCEAKSVRLAIWPDLKPQPQTRLGDFFIHYLFSFFDPGDIRDSSSLKLKNEARESLTLPVVASL